ncbi:MAG: response regulator transcription factor [Campylobacterota bacterium]|nr:response regulator transcription factor [Campylobacterota bacterium]
MRAKLLLLEDDITFNETICDYLSDEDFEVTPAFSGYEAQDILYENSFDLLLLDVNVPQLNGFELLKLIRANGVNTPAIYITSLNSIDSLEEGFESGCDDYIRKPFELKELLFRVESILKREFFHSNNSLIELSSNTSYDTKTNMLIVDGIQNRLNNKDGKLLKLFMQHKNEIISHEVIQEHLWDFDETPSDNALRTYIKNLRKLIGKEKIVSIKKLGYKFNS